MNSAATPKENEGASAPRPVKVLITKIGLDGHDRGSRVVAAFLRDAGMEVIYTAPWQDISQIVQLVQEEDVEVVGISSLASDHLLVPRLLEEFRAGELGHVAVIVGGIIPPADEQELLQAGVAGVFHPGSSGKEIVEAVRSLAEQVRERRPVL